MPKLKCNLAIKHFEGRFYAHRGLHKNRSKAPENSIPAFRLAIENSYGIELDVQLTKDEVPVVIHDYNLLRICGVNQKIAELTYEELQQYYLYKSKERIPTFTEALACIDGKVPLIIELKIPSKASRTCEIVAEALKSYPGVYCIESFNPFGLIWYRKNKPQIMRGQLSSNFLKDKEEGSKFQYFVLKNFLLNFLTKPDFISYNYVHKKDISFTICRKLYRVITFAWTIKSQEALESNKDLFDFFIFDSFIPTRKN